MKTEDELIAELSAACANRRAKEWCKKHSVSQAYVCDILKRRRSIGELVANALGYERVVMFRPLRRKIAKKG